MLCYEKGCIGIILKGGKVEIFLVCHSYPEGGGGEATSTQLYPDVCVEK